MTTIIMESVIRIGTSGMIDCFIINLPFVSLKLFKRSLILKMRKIYKEYWGNSAYFLLFELYSMIDVICSTIDHKRSGFIFIHHTVNITIKF